MLLRSTALLLAGAWIVCGSAGATELRGVNTHPLWGGRATADFDRELNLVRAAGADTVRIDLSWSTLELAGPGQFDSAYTAKIDTFVQHAADRGINVIATVWSTPCWASSAPDSLKQSCAGAWWERGVQLYPPTDPRTYGAISGWIADRWGDDLAGIEVWNEPNSAAFFTAPDRAAAYAPLVRAAHTSVKAEAPGLPVVAGSLVWSDTQFLKRLYTAGIAGAYDAISIHPYDDPALRTETGDVRYSFFDGVPAFRQAMVASGDGDRPLWLTEFGSPTCPPTTFRWCTTREGQAQRLTDAFNAIRGWDYVDAAIVYELRDGGTNPADFEQNMGLVTSDFGPKPAYDAFSAAMQPAPPSSPPSPPPPKPRPEPPATSLPAPPKTPATVGPSFAGALLRSRSATVTRGVVRIRVVSAHGAEGTLRLKRGRLTIGRKSFRLKAGRPRRIAVRLTRAGRKALAAKRRLTTTVSISARDSAGRRRTTSARLVVRLRRVPPARTAVR